MLKKTNKVNPSGIKTKLKNHFLFSTIHGIQHIVRTPNSLVKFVWFFCFLSAIATCAYFMSVSLSNYLNYKVVTYLNTIYEDRSEFPALSICSSVEPLNNLSILKCEFNRDDCSGYFKFYNDQYYNTCLRFNSGENNHNKPVDILATTVGGYKYGLRIDLNLSSAYDFNELIVFVHNQTYKPNNLRNKGDRVLTGTINYFQIEKIVDEKLGKPYSECLKDTSKFTQNKTIINYINQNNNSYSQVECIRLCRNLINAEQSGCNCAKGIDMPMECEQTQNETVRNCYEKFLRRFQKKNVLEVCSAYCPLECDSITYSIKLSTQYLPSSGLINTSFFEYPQFEFYEKVKKSYLSIRVYYLLELRYLHIKQQPNIETVDLVSQIGGTLGLFLGISFLSFIELIELFIEILFILLKKNRV